MLSKCYNCNNFVTNVDSGKNSYIVNSGTRKDIAAPAPALIAHIQTRKPRKPQASCEQAASWKATSYKLKGEATMKKFYKVEGISAEGYKVIDCTCYTTREDAEKAIVNGNYLTKNNKMYARITEIEA